MMGRYILTAAACAVAVGTVVGFGNWSARADDVGQRLEAQRIAQAETDFVVRRLQTLVRVLDFFQADQTTHKKTMEEMSRVLSGLSEDQMRDVIARLETAVKAGETNLNPDQDQMVWAKHREILDTLKDMIGRFDAVQNLDQAAERFDKFARQQFELHLAAAQVSRARGELADVELKGADRLAVEQRIKAGRNFDGARLAEQQKDMQKDVLLLMKQIVDIDPKLSAEHKRRVETMREFAIQTKVVQKLVESVVKLAPTGTPAARARNQADGIELQAELAHRYALMAHLLRFPPDQLVFLKAVRSKVSSAVRQQDDVLVLTSALTDSREKALEIAAKCREYYDRQAWIQFHSLVCEDVLRDAVDDAADFLAEAREEMKSARSALVKYEPKDAVAPEGIAKEKLTLALAALNRRIEKLELAKKDPLVALMNFGERLDRLIAEQSATRGTTKAGQLPESTARQHQHAKETMNLLALPLPSKDKIEPLLYKAESAMSGAIKELEAAKAASAVPHQDRALVALKEARELLAIKIEAAKVDAKTLDPNRDPKADPKDVAAAQASKGADEIALQPKNFDVPQAADQVRAALEHTLKARDNLPNPKSDTAKNEPPKAETIKVDPEKVAPKEPTAKNGNETPKVESHPDPKIETAKVDPPKTETIKVDPEKVGPQDPSPKGAPMAKKDQGAPKGDPMAKGNPTKGDPMKGDGEPDPLAQAKQNTQDAQSLLAQAQAQAPPSVQGPLNDAGKKLADAKQKLDGAKPGDAQSALAQAEMELRNALMTLDAVKQAMDQPMTPNEPKMAKAGDPKMGDKPGQQPGQQPGDKPGEGMKPGDPKPGQGKEQNAGKGAGDRKEDGQVAKARSKLNDVDGAGTFLHLPERQRELIRQSLNANLPPEYANSIQQYYANVARGRPATNPPR